MNACHVFAFYSNGQEFWALLIRDLRINKIPSFEREGWLCQPSLSKLGILFSCKSLRRMIFLFGAARRTAPNKKIIPGLSNAEF